MDKSTLDILRTNNSPRSFSSVLDRLEKEGQVITPTVNVNGESVYQFFDTYSESLQLNNNSISISEQPVESDIPYHYHNYVEMMVPLRGGCTVIMKNKPIHLKQDDVLIIGNHSIHKVDPIGPDDIVVNISLRDTAFSLNELNALLQNNSHTNISGMLFSLLSDKNYGEGRYSFFKTNHNKKISETIWEIIDEYYHPDSQSEQIIRLEVMVLFSRLIREAYNNVDIDWKGDDKKTANLLSLLLYIEKNYSDITLDKMAKDFGYNSNYLSSFLKKATGLTFIKLVHLQRINVAAEYLTYTEAPIEKISFKVGYENPSYFYKIFKNTLNVSPDIYRKKARSNAQ
ncbi:AraC family transcriptional regulator [Companilactobacillus kimchiensis]|uniref:Transcriptional regulator-type n=1 Tax=Companilactobacillus kimchiensis TaxID=993692 RepID=A0A0R2LBF8_9LACO|nr:AraC family transcriptional regulator [Companilactobacillus kimchiensis]KRN98785.1 transcriptional regulator-type [Companilactobacillus kimchiensis]